MPLLTENNGLVGLKMNWTLLDFGKRSGQVHERQAQVAEAEENLRQVENRVRVEIEKEVRKVRRAETGLEAARESVAARAEMRRITANQVEAKTVNSLRAQRSRRAARRGRGRALSGGDGAQHSPRRAGARREGE